MQDFNFFKTYYPTARYLIKETVPTLLCEMVPQQNLLVELGCGAGPNLKLFHARAWSGRVIAYDLCLRYAMPTVPNVTLIVGDVMDTLKPGDEPIDVLYLDLDQQPGVTRHALRQLSQQTADSWIYIDEFLGEGPDAVQECDARTFANWLLEVYRDFDVLAYTDNGALIKLGQGHSADHLIISLDDYRRSTKF